MAASSEQLELARNSGATALEHFIQFVYHTIRTIGFASHALYLWVKIEYTERVSAQNVKTGNTIY